MIRHYLFPVVGIILGFSACRSSETNEKQVLMVKTETVKNYENELQVTYPGRDGQDGHGSAEIGRAHV